jgi:hypothetical protein
MMMTRGVAMPQGEGGLFQQVASAVTQRLKAMEAAGEPGVTDHRDIILSVYRRVATRRPSLPSNPTDLRSIIETEIDRALKADRDAWTAPPGAGRVAIAGGEPSEVVLALLKRGMTVEAIKRYRVESGLGLWDARAAVAAFARSHGLTMGKQ